jgi:hypothetical protein
MSPVPPAAPTPTVDQSVLWTLVESVDAAIASRPPGSRPGGAMVLRLTAAPPTDGPGPPSDGPLDGDHPPSGVAGLADDALDLGVHPLDGDHPLEALLGFVAPPDWLALGVTSPGLGHPTPGEPGGGRRASERVHVTVLLSRTGAAAGVIRRDAHASRLGEAPGGVVADACRRALGLPTAPPPPTTAGLWTLSWLDRLVETLTASAGPPGPMTWPEATGLHPAAPTTAPPTPEALAQATGHRAAEWPWPRLRADPPRAGTPGPQPTPAQAAWMDDGMFARWLLAWFPPLDDLLDACHDLLPEAVADRVEDTVTLSLTDPEDLP